MRFIVLLFGIARFAAACGTPTAPEYTVEISVSDSVVARRGPGEVNLVIPIKLRNLDARPLYYEECGHALQRRVGSSWQLVPFSLCRGTTPYSIELDTGASYQFTFRVKLSLPSDEWPAVGAPGEYRVVLWLTSVFRNSYGIPPQPLAASSRTSPVFSIREEVIDH
jgi:hypothetical protein